VHGSRLFRRASARDDRRRPPARRGFGRGKPVAGWGFLMDTGSLADALPSLSVARSGVSLDPPGACAGVVRMRRFLVFLVPCLLVPLLLAGAVYGLFLLWGRDLPSPRRPQEWNRRTTASFWTGTAS